MQKRLVYGGRIEIAPFLVEGDVRHIEDRRDEAAAETAHIRRQQQEMEDGDRHQSHEQEGRIKPADATFVKAQQRPGPRAHVRNDRTADQKTGNDEEDVDTDIAAAEAGNAEMIENHPQHGDRAQPVDIGAIAAMFAVVRRREAQKACAQGALV